MTLWRGMFGFLAALLLIFTPMAARAAPPAPPGTEKVTIDALLQAENLGSVWFSPDGRRLMFARGTPAADLHERGQSDITINGDRLMLAELAGGAPVQIGNYAPLHNDPWRPDGSGALMMWVKNGAYGLTYWDRASGRTLELPGRIDWSFATLAWAGDRLIYETLADDDIQFGAWPQVSAYAAAKWRAAWTGDQPVVSVYSTDPLFAPTAPSPRRLMLADLKTGQSKLISEGEYGGRSLKVSPDGRYLAAVRLTTQLADSLSWLGRRGELQIFELKGDGAVLMHTLSNLDFADSGFAWSPDGRRLLIGAKALDAPRASGRVYEVDAISGAARQLGGEGLRFVSTGTFVGSGFLPLGWIGDTPVAIASRADASARATAGANAGLDYGENNGLRFDLYDLSQASPRALTSFSKASVRNFAQITARGEALVVSDGALWRIAAAAPPVRLTPPGFDRVLDFAVDRQLDTPPPASAYYRDGAHERISLLVSSKGGESQYRVLDLRTGKAEAIGPAEHVMAATGDRTSFVIEARDGWATSYALKTPKGERSLVTVNTALNRYAIAKPMAFDFDYKGQKLRGWVLPPPGPKPDHPLPAIVDVYGGEVLGDAPPFAALPDPLGPQFNGQLIAAQGYAVIYPSTPLQAGADTDVMRTLADECIAAVDALAAKGLVDPKRVGIKGQSFGGFSTAAVLSEASDRFRAGVASSGIYDWTAIYGVPAMEDLLSFDTGGAAGEIKMIEDGQIRLGKPPWIAIEAYRRNSPVYRVEHINSPLLLISGDLDGGGTGLPGALRMFDALRRAGKDAALVRYWGEGHVLTSAADIRDQVRRMLSWFDAYVKNPAPEAAKPGG
jgi:dipeptidyl aminopeptidase/acylaminoacyl peptidase